MIIFFHNNDYFFVAFGINTGFFLTAAVEYWLSRLIAKTTFQLLYHKNSDDGCYT